MNTALITLATDHLHSEAVFLRSAQMRCKEDFTPPFLDSQLSLVPQYRGGPTGTFHVVTATDSNTGETRRAALFYYQVGVRLVGAESIGASDSDEAVSEESVYLEIECEFCSQYGVDDSIEEEPLRLAFDEFARYNVGYHVWPYWREYVQSTCARVGIPPIPVPMYRIPASARESNPPDE